MRTYRHHRDAITKLLLKAAEFELSPKAKQKLTWFAFAARHGGNISLTCRHFGIGRTTFIRWYERFDPSDVSTLEEASRSPHRVRRSHVPRAVIAMIAELRKLHPAMNKETIRDTLARKGIALSASTVGRIIARHRLFFGDSPFHCRKRGETDASGPFLLLEHA